MKRFAALWGAAALLAACDRVPESREALERARAAAEDARARAEAALTNAQSRAEAAGLDPKALEDLARARGRDALAALESNLPPRAVLTSNLVQGASNTLQQAGSFLRQAGERLKETGERLESGSAAPAK
jgi:membrane-bound lytic murein transglycosylase B